MYAILDIETTGGKYNEEGITEVAIYRFDSRMVIDQFISLVNPEKEIQPFVVKLTGINNKMLVNAPKFYEVAKRIIEITEDCTLVAHNAQFDYRILKTEFSRLGYEYNRRSLCTVELSQKLLPEQPSYSLGKLVRSLGIPVSDRHRANGDAMATLKLFKILLAKDSGKTIIQDTIRTASTGILAPRLLDIVERIPSETGVYYFHNDDGKIIHIGRSRNMKKSVNDIFTKLNSYARNLQKEVKAVTYDLTGNELIAKLKELEEIRINRPKFNRRNKKQAPQFAIYDNYSVKGYRELKIGDFNPREKALYHFRTLQEAGNFMHRINDEFNLCDKLNGLSEAKEQCYNETIGECHGACIGREAPETYNKRVSEAIERYSLTTMNAVITDSGRDIDEKGIIVLKEGKLQGYGYINLQFQITKQEIVNSIITPLPSNPATQYLIESYIRKRKNLILKPL
ncbi:exonuclease domain-containing protein [Robertkochia solimangrovi]|uniref:exonuclease domain-containing protein n=1 Tax=Robertkochia solimangrovi TaxID=2213046 RepID=UPI00117C2DE9|nr:exonuclease domain-containing protein [Robertkochia solimangrovi]TRZ45385.1 exonuclease [Robertkochia solimangrovi]